MHSQLSYAAAKLEIADHHRRADREISNGQAAQPARRRNPLERLFRLRRTAPAIDITPVRQDAC